ncbi:hypothetical protein MesoLj131a_62900 [Mesorhizobium sp. 131-2-1]|nr:hypothetical protein MesoLj131a_62900 [Mesorhizobium sp. 131-2-1]
MLEKTRTVVSVALANNAADSVAARRVLTVTLSLSNALQQIRQTSLQTLCERKLLTMIRSL